MHRLEPMDQSRIENTAPEFRMLLKILSSQRFITYTLCDLKWTIKVKILFAKV